MRVNRVAIAAGVLAVFVLVGGILIHASLNQGGHQVTFNLNVTGAKVMSPVNFTARPDDIVTINMTSDTEGEVHLHVYDIQFATKPGQVVSHTFKADKTCSCDIEWESTGALLGQLVVSLVIPAAGILLHGFGQRYDLPISLALYLYAAAGVVVISFVLVGLFAGDQVGATALHYPRRAVRWLTAAARSEWPRRIGGAIGVLALVAVVIAGLFGSTNPVYNLSEYLVWIYFWAGLVIFTGLVGNVWYLVNPWAAIYDAMSKFERLRPVWKLPDVGVWPAAAAYFAFACLELTTGMANRPWLVATLALAYSAVTLAGMILFGRDEWLEHCESFTVLFGIVARFGPIEAERDEAGRIAIVYVRPWGVGLLKPAPTGWDRVGFVILMLSTLAFDGILSTPAWQDFTVALQPVWLPMGALGFFFMRTLGLVMLSVAFLLVFITFMELVV